MTEKRKEQMRQANRRYRLRKKMEKLLRIKQEEKEHEERMTKTPIKKHQYANEETSIDNRKSEEIISCCDWCGVLKGLDSNQLCKFCRQFDSKEEMLAEKEWSKRESMLRMMGDSDLIPRQRKQYHSDWKCSCGFVNVWYAKQCKSCNRDR